MSEHQVIWRIKDLAQTILPAGSSLWLYGSRARGDAREGSDWDLLILLDKDIITASDYDVTYPFRELGWEIGEEISPHLYSKQQWEKWTFLPYYKNVEHDKLILL